MTRSGFRTLIAFLSAGIPFGAPTPALAQIDVPAVLGAIKDEFCIGEYWVPSPRRSPETWPVAVRIDGDVAYAWMERFEKPRTRWATFYAFARRDGKLTVTSRMGYDTEFMHANPGYLEIRNRVFGEDWAKHAFGVELRSAELNLPFECTRIFAADTPDKLAIVEAIRRSVAKMLPFNKDAARLPKRVRIVIANFNVDDGMTYVVNRETNEVLGVTLYDGLETALSGSTYIVWQQRNASAVPKIRRKVLATGIEREIQYTK